MTCIQCDDNNIHIDLTGSKTLSCPDCGMTLSLAVIDMREYGSWVFIKSVLSDAADKLEKRTCTEHESAIGEAMRAIVHDISVIGYQADGDVWVKQ